MIASFPDRRFQLWEYRVSHGSLLLRSPRGPEISHNVDIVFVGVEFLCAPRLFRGLELAQGTEEESAAPPLESPKLGLSGSSCCCLRGGVIWWLQPASKWTRTSRTFSTAPSSSPSPARRCAVREMVGAKV